MLIEKLKAQPCCVLGLGAEGVSTLKFLLQQGSHQLAVADQTPFQELSTEVRELLVQHPEITQHLGPNYLAALASYSVIVKAAGVSPYLPEIARLESSAHYLITSNTELFFDWAATQTNLVTIGVTGTKGKSTTSSLLQHVLATNDIPSVLGGNVGVPCLELIASLQLLPATQTRFALLELSSHQTRRLRYSPNIVVLQAITPEHLDYYPELEDYYQAKADIVKQQTAADQVIARWDNDVARKTARSSLAAITWFSSAPTTETTLTAWIESNQLTVAGESIISLTDLPVAGAHNAINTLPSCIIGTQLGLTPSQLRASIKTFSALPHRLEKIAEFDQITFVNDSAGTTPEATAAALEAFSSQSVILLAGGSDKQIDLSPMITAIGTHQVKAVLLFPTTGETIAQQLRQQFPDLPMVKHHLYQVDSMSQAFTIIQQIMTAGDVVLLSPGCASFGVFANYKDRGEQFRAAVLALAP